jgi:nucleotide sugar dehydrogenase
MSFEMKNKVTVIGAGKMGLPLACAFASRGADVWACDVNAQVVESINAGRCPFDEPGVQEMLSDAVAAGRLRATTDTAKAISESEVIVVIVPVLLTDQREADLHIIDSIADILKGHLRKGSLVSFETTLPVGGTRRLGKIIEGGGMAAGVDFDLVFSPERVKSQRVLKHLFDNPKVVGGITPESARRGEAFYSRYLGAPVTNVGSLEAAEMVKLAGMVYRDVNIALANELANYAQAVGVDFESVRQAANTDGEAALLIPGIGVGGHCTPVYPYFLIQEARRRGLQVALPEAARKLNESQPGKAVDRLGDLAGRRAIILGICFRPQVKETAYSPAFALRDELQRRLATVTAHDPLCSEEEIRRLGFDPGKIEGNEIAILNTAHSAYCDLDWRALARSGLKIVLDGRNALSADRIRAAGIRYLGIGCNENV